MTGGIGWLVRLDSEATASRGVGVYSESKKSRKKSLEWEVMIEESKRGEWKMYM